jgi:hypothetical protein
METGSRLNHVVRRVAASRIRDINRYAFNVDEGLTDLVCSEWESTQANRVAMNETLAAAIASERMDEPVGAHVAQTMQQTNCRVANEKRAACET